MYMGIQNCSCRTKICTERYGIYICQYMIADLIYCNSVRIFIQYWLLEYRLNSILLVVAFPVTILQLAFPAATRYM